MSHCTAVRSRHQVGVECYEAQSLSEKEINIRCFVHRAKMTRLLLSGWGACGQFCQCNKKETLQDVTMQYIAIQCCQCRCHSARFHGLKTGMPVCQYASNDSPTTLHQPFPFPALAPGYISMIILILWFSPRAVSCIVARLVVPFEWILSNACPGTRVASEADFSLPGDEIADSQVWCCTPMMSRWLC